MQRKYAVILSFAGTLILLGALSAQTAVDNVPFPTGLRDWFMVNSMIVTKDSPISDQIGGMHMIYVNAKGLPTLKNGGPLPYPDGTVFGDDVHEFSVKDGSYVEGNKKAIAVMVKDAKKYATTGGWGFQVWAGGDVAKPLVPIRLMRLRRASPVTPRKKITTSHSPPTFPEKAGRVVEKLRYLHRNPVKRGLCARAEDWAWSSFLQYATGCAGRVEIECEWAARKRERQAGTLRPAAKLPHSSQRTA